MDKTNKIILGVVSCFSVLILAIWLTVVTNIVAEIRPAPTDNSSEISELNAQLAELSAENAALRVVIEQLRAERSQPVNESEAVAEERQEAAAVSVTLYDKLAPDEIDMLERVVQHEVGGLSAQYRAYVVELLYNRLVSDKFPDDVREMLFQPYQFGGISRWLYTVTPDETTKQVVRDVFTAEAPTHKATAYYNPDMSSASAVSWFENSLTFCFEVNEVSWGRNWRTRFFEV